MERETKKDNSRLVLAVFLILSGSVWLIHKLAVSFHLIGIHFKTLLFPFRQIFADWGSFLFSWQVVLILVGLILLAGKRSAGIVLIVLGGLSLAPKILLFPQFSLSFLVPAILIGAGIALIAKLV